jgi:Flp pilus assembly protein TadD
MRNTFSMLVLSPWLLIVPVFAAPPVEAPPVGTNPAVIRAEKLYRHTDYEAAIRLLANAPQKDTAVKEMLGRCYFMAGDYKKATDSLEKAAAAEPNNSVYRMWLGRVYGRRAESAFALNAMSWASKSRASLEQATELDPKNWEAIDDLFDFYLQAPGILGGGLDKAEKLADIVNRRDPAEAAYDRARIAEARKQFASAEAHLKQAARLAPHQAGRFLALAKFFAQHGRFEESDQAFAKAEQVAPDAPKVLFVEAATYIKTNRNVDTARVLLKRYLNASNLTPDDPPKSEAEKLLRKVSGS